MLEKDNISRIKPLLKAYPKGLTITDISSKLKMNRNSAAKYLEVLLISGQVETQSYGTARVFFLTHRIPISAMLSTSSDLVVALDETRKAVFCNDSFLTFFGIARDQILGHHIVEIYRQGFQDITFSDLFTDILVNPDIIREIPINKPTANYFFRIKSIKTVFDDGSPGITVVMEDVTAHRKALDAIRESEARFRVIFEKSQDGLILYSADQHMDSPQWECNQRTLTLFGYASREECITVHPADLSPAFQPNGQDSLSAANAHLKNAKEKGEERFEWVHKKKDGTTFPAEVSLSAFELEGKTVILTSVKDITDRKQAEADLIESEKKRAEDAIKNSENYLLTIFNSTQSGLVVIDPETHTIYDANSTAVELIGTEKSNIVGSSCKSCSVLQKMTSARLPISARNSSVQKVVSSMPKAKRNLSSKQLSLYSLAAIHIFLKVSLI